MGTVTTDQSQFRTSVGATKLDPRMTNIIQSAASASPYNVELVSGVRAFNPKEPTTNHPGGYAIDVQLSDPATGQVIPNYQSGPSYAAYEQFAQTARVVQQQMYPELNNTFRWGGYFNSKKGPSGYGAVDLMHFDINPKMAGATGFGSWENGASPALLKAYPEAQSNGGLSNPRVVSQIKQQIAGGPTPPANIPTPPTPALSPLSLRNAPLSAADGLAFNPVSPDMSSALPLAYSAPDGSVEVPQTIANSSGSPDDRDSQPFSYAAPAPPPQIANSSGSPDDRDSGPLSYSTAAGPPVPATSALSLRGVPLPAYSPTMSTRDVAIPAFSPTLSNRDVPSPLPTTSSAVAAIEQQAPTDLSSLLAYASGSPQGPMAASSRIAAPAQQTNAKGYVIGQTYTLKDGASYLANANGSFTKTANTPRPETTIQLALDLANPNSLLNTTINSAKSAPAAFSAAGQQATSALGSAAGSVGSFFGGLLGGGSSPAPAAPAQSNGPFNYGSGSPASSPSASSDNGGWGYLMSSLAGPSAPVAADSSTDPFSYTTPTPAPIVRKNTSGSPDDRDSAPISVAKTVQVANPAYTAWLNNQAPVSPFTNPGVQGLSPDDRDSPDGIARAVPGLTSPVFAKAPAPPKTIPKIIHVTIPAPRAPAGPVPASAPAAPAPAPVQGPIASPNGYTYLPTGNGGYTRVGVVNPSLSPSQQYAQAGAAALASLPSNAFGSSGQNNASPYHSNGSLAGN